MQSEEILFFRTGITITANVFTKRLSERTFPVSWKKEEKIFDTFIGLAAYAIKYPSENYTIYWQKLDEYEEDAILELLKATLIIDDQTQERINEIEAQRIERNNEKNKGKTPDFFHGVYTFS